MSEGPAVVFGASGYTGLSVVRALRARGIPTVAHLRPDSPRLAELSAEWSKLGASTDCTPWEAPAIRERVVALKPRAVFSLLGTTRQREKADRAQGKDSSYAAVDVAMSLMALEGARNAETSPRFVYLSALGTGPNARGAYYAARWTVEQAVVASGLPYIIARPAIIGGDRPESRVGERLALVVTDGLLGGLAALGIRGPAARWGSRTGEVLGSSLVRLALAPDTASRVYRPEELMG